MLLLLHIALSRFFFGESVRFVENKQPVRESPEKIKERENRRAAREK